MVLEKWIFGKLGILIKKDIDIQIFKDEMTECLGFASK